MASLSPLPPWLQINPAQFIEAARAGSTLGLQIAQTQNRGDEMAAERAMQAAQMKAREEQAQREEAFRRWELEQRLQQQAAELAAQREHSAAQMAETSKYNLARIEEEKAGNLARANYYERLGKAAGAPKVHFGPNGDVLSYDPKTGGVTVLRKGTPRAAADYTTVSTTTRGTEGEEGTMAVPETPAKRILGIPVPFTGSPGKPGTPAVPGTPSMTVTRRIPRGEPVPGLAAPAPAPLPAAASSPFKEGTRLRSKKDGKLYQVKGGMPVLVGE